MTQNATVSQPLPTILVVDDDPDMLVLLRRFLSKAGYTPILAEDGERALQLFGDHRPDLVLMDARMPGRDGFETSRELRRAHPRDRTPIIMVTALADDRSVDEAFRNGAEEYITKPIHWAVLRHRIATLLNRRRMEQELKESEERFRSLAESSSDAIISADARGRILFWNQGAQRCFGYAESEVLYQSLSLLMPPRFREAHERGLGRVVTSGHLRLAGQTVELTGMRKNGEEFPLEVTLSTWEIGEERFFSAIIREITQRKQLERERELALQTRIAISALLETALEPLTLRRQLEVALEIIHTLPWLAVSSRGGIFLADEERRRLTLAVQKGWNDDLVQSCERVPYGECLCGLAAASREILFANQVDQRHQRTVGGMTPHGHYCVPILFHQRLLGVLNVYLPHLHAYNPEEEGILHTIAQTLATIIERRRMEEALEQTHTALKETRLEIIHRLGMAAEFRDNETGMHIIRMSRYAALLARAAGLGEERSETILHAAPMHDVGKIGITDSILLKRGRLTDEEFQVMRAHTTIGAHMLFGHDEEPLKTAHIIALTHHEKWDGSGYPHGLAGEGIPIEGRICAVADVFDALTSERPYKHAWREEEAVAELQRCAGSHFDPRLVALFIELLPRIREIREAFADTPSPTLGLLTFSREPSHG